MLGIFAVCFLYFQKYHPPLLGPNYYLGWLHLILYLVLVESFLTKQYFDDKLCLLILIVHLSSVDLICLTYSFHRHLTLCFDYG